MSENSPYIDHFDNNNHMGGNVSGGDLNCAVRNVVVVIIILLLLYMYNKSDDMCDGFQNDFSGNNIRELNSGRNDMMRPHNDMMRTRNDMMSINGRGRGRGRGGGRSRGKGGGRGGGGIGGRGRVRGLNNMIQSSLYR
jgi:hypothetical protein